MECQGNEMDFARLEMTVFRLAVLMVREGLVEVLQALDEYLAAVRDSGRYEAREIEERTLDTLVGPVCFRRRCYRDRQTGERVHLLDEKLKIKGYQRVSAGLANAAVTLAAAGPSYRNARDRLEGLIGERVVSHEGVRQLVLKTAQVMEKAEPAAGPRKRRPVLFLEVDGLWTGRQHKKKKRGKKEETKFALVHEGWRERYPGSKEHETVTTLRYIHPAGSGEDFWEGLRRELERTCDLEDTLVVINGDGASWIRKGVEYFALSLYQHNRFHISREVAAALKGDRELKAEGLRALREDDLGRLVRVVETAMGQASGKDRTRLRELLKTIRSDWEYILDYRLRLRALGYDCTGFRGLGSGESNIGKFKSRTRGRSWSTGGLQALGNVLFKLLDGSLGAYTSQVVSRADERLDKMVTAGAKALRRAVLSSEPGVKKGHFPCLDRGTAGYAELFRQILKEGFAL